MGAGRKRKAAPWDKASGWKQVKVGDDLMLGSTEGGFMGLEVLEPDETLLFGHHKRQAQQAPDAEDEEMLAEVDEVASDKKPKKPKKSAEMPQSKKAKLSEPGSTPPAVTGPAKTSLEQQLNAKIAALEAENSALKAKNASKPDKLAGKDKEKASSKAKQDKTARNDKEKVPKNAKQGKAATTAAAPVLADVKAATTEQIDMSAWSEFDLHPQIAAAISQAGFTQPTPIQEQCLLPAIRDRRDVIGAAQTGSGKTLAFGLPILQRLMLMKAESPEGTKTKLKALILTPTRELALQVCEHLQRVGKVCGIWAVPIVGGISPIKQERLLKKFPEVVVATPGRLWELMQEGHAHLTDMSNLAFFVLDEADRMVQTGHFQEMEHILDHIKSSRVTLSAQPDEFDHKHASDDSPTSDESADEAADEAADEQPSQARKQKRLQTMVFSATLTLPQRLRSRFKKGGGGSSGSATLDRLMDKIPFGPKPKIVDLTSDRKLADKVVEACLQCSDAARDEVLYYILVQHPGRTLVFVNAISSVRRVAALLKLLGLPAQALHASMQQRQRLKALDRFKADPAGVLVATDVAARGLDIPDVRCVIHYQLAASADVYVHRSGRTARAARDGLTIALVTPKEAARYQGLQKAMDRPVPCDFPVDTTLMPSVHKRVRLAIRLDEVQRQQTKEKAEHTWRKRSADEAGIELSDDEGDLDPYEDDLAVRDKGGRKTGGRQTGTADPAASAQQLQKELAECLADPLVPKFSHKFFTGGVAAAVGAQRGVNSATETSDDGGGAPQQAPVVKQAVEYANKVQKHRKSAVAAAVGNADDKNGQQGRAARQRSGPSKISREMAEEQALQAALTKSRLKKGDRQRNSKLMVIPAAFGREKHGSDALQALRTKMGVSQTAKQQ